MRAVDLIRTKRDGGPLERAALEWFVAGVTDGSLPDYQASALLMAIVLRGMTPDETAALTDAMVRSGVRVSYDGLAHVPVEAGGQGAIGAVRVVEAGQRDHRHVAAPGQSLQLRQEPVAVLVGHDDVADDHVGQHA